MNPYKKIHSLPDVFFEGEWIFLWNWMSSFIHG